MTNYLAQKYAYLLTKEDTQHLFNTLAKVYGSIKNAALKCGIQRKTVYDWPRTADIRLITKTKILEASIKTKSDYTLRFLLERSEERTSEILYVMLTRFFERAMTPELDRRTFSALSKKFERLRKRHAGLIFEHLEEDVSDMSHLLHEKAENLQVSLPPPAIETMKSTQILELLPTIIKSLPEKETPAGYPELSAKFNVPLELVEVSSTISQIARAPYVERQKSETTEPVYPGSWSPAGMRYKPEIKAQEPADSYVEYALWEEKA